MYKINNKLKKSTPQDLLNACETKISVTNKCLFTSYIILTM